MNNLGISSKAANASLKTLNDGIQGLPTTLNAATQGVTRFVSKNGDIKKSTEYFLAMNNAVIAGGQSAELQGYAVEQLAQAYSKGKMEMEEWKSIQTAMPGQLNQIAKAMGMTADELGEEMCIRDSDKAIETAIKKAREQWDLETDTKLSEAEKLARMTKEQKAEYKAQQMEKELNKLKAEKARTELAATARKMLSDENIAVPDSLLTYIVGEDAENCLLYTSRCV